MPGPRPLTSGYQADVRDSWFLEVISQLSTIVLSLCPQLCPMGAGVLDGLLQPRPVARGREAVSPCLRCPGRATGSVAALACPLCPYLSLVLQGHTLCPLCPWQLHGMGWLRLTGRGFADPFPQESPGPLDP